MREKRIAHHLLFECLAQCGVTARAINELRIPFFPRSVYTSRYGTVYKGRQSVVLAADGVSLPKSLYKPLQSYLIGHLLARLTPAYLLLLCASAVGSCVD